MRYFQLQTIAFVLTATIAAAEARPWVYIDMPGASLTDPVAISGRNHVIGTYVESDGFTSHGFLRDPDGTLHDVIIPGYSHPLVTGINAKGAIAGRVEDGQGRPIAFVRAPNGSVTTFTTLSGSNMIPTAINGHGEVAGFYGDHG